MSRPGSHEHTSSIARNSRNFFVITIMPFAHAATCIDRPLALFAGSRRHWPSAAAVDVLARHGPDLLLSFLFAGVSDQGPHRSRWHPARRRISACDREARDGAVLVCTHHAVALQ